MAEYSEQMAQVRIEKAFGTGEWIQAQGATFQYLEVATNSPMLAETWELTGFDRGPNITAEQPRERS